jgi:hypothetical protein
MRGEGQRTCGIWNWSLETWGGLGGQLSDFGVSFKMDGVGFWRTRFFQNGAWTSEWVVLVPETMQIWRWGRNGADREGKRKRVSRKRPSWTLMSRSVLRGRLVFVCLSSSRFSPVSAFFFCVSYRELTLLYHVRAAGWGSNL